MSTRDKYLGNVDLKITGVILTWGNVGLRVMLENVDFGEMLTCVNALGKCRVEKMLTLSNVDLGSTGFMSNWGNVDFGLELFQVIIARRPFSRSSHCTVDHNLTLLQSTTSRQYFSSTFL